MKKILKRKPLRLLVICAVICAFITTSAASAQTVNAAARKTSVKLNYTSLVLIKGKAFNLKATVKGTSRKPSWSSSRSSVAAVNRNGRITARNYGTATISARVNGVTARCRVTVVANYKYLYKKFLTSNSRNIKWFYMLNVNKSGVPELITTNSGGGITSYNVYTIRGTRVVKAGSYSARGINSSRPFFYYVSRHKCLYASGWTNMIGGTWGNLYGMSGYKLVHRYHAREAHYPKSVYYTGRTDSSARKVSKASYVKFCNTYFKGYSRYSMKKNTASIRNQAFR